MRLTDIPSVSSVLSRMESLTQLSKDPKSLVSFPELLEREFSKQTQIPSASLPEEKVNLVGNIQLPFPAGLEKPNANERIGSQQPDKLLESIESIAEAQGLDPNLVKAMVKAESGFKPKAVSPKGAMGLMQLMPETADRLGVKDPFDPEENVAGGVKFLKGLLKEFKDPEKAIAAYNAGPGAVKRYNGIPPYEETKQYVSKVKRFYQDFSSK
ncbi:Transglycosylase [Leptospira biflexa serovar Patoc strain 'Patoc 1 (Ames)']|uniref:Putative soluble lytic murein transglycosylase putative SLT domain n=1 Tax=Leptospira biflexa serovar Patoc (strain Patoc 1 / ATCC 23582 / Paris) TaxID=456481 RepID=B0STQ0_LEPBP|nr:lytic transglycosylase domain-containing protein [Leptospira biflexa]ABZ95870.1 Transglycosylase [Leptospira biflexa serovar Patoc strain 'Patoc 1 (Ames)']ABZ99584.1 Putative soluble lytic murein transglycosylase; putative SLT domain [Leptospira biflexa serovar Patoc strain 'Patoc 1 (Paris)']